MRIAIATPVFPPYRGGIGTVACHHARLLAQRGQEVVVFTPDYGQSTVHDHPMTPFPRNTRDRLLLKEREVILLKPVLKYGNAAWVPQLAHQLENFDAVILQYPFFGGMAAVLRAKKKYGFRLIVNYNMDVVAALCAPSPRLWSVGDQGFGWSSSLKGLVFWYATKFFLPRIIKRADVALASSQDYAEHSDLRRFWSDEEKFQIVPIGVDMERFKPDPSARPADAGLGRDDEVIVLFVGGLDKAHYFKGVEYLIKAMSLIEPPTGPLLSKGGGIRLVIAGSGDLADQYKKLARHLGVADRVNFTGNVSDEELVKLYQISAVTVLPSVDQSESFGIVLAESMACGTPVISSNLPGVRSVYEDGVSGITVPVRDERALASAISTLLNDPVRAREIGAAARALTEKRYNWNSIGDRLLAVCGAS